MTRPRRRITALVALPPPVTGQTTVNAAVVAQLRRCGDVRLFDYSAGFTGRGWRWKVRKAVRNLIAPLWLTLRWPAPDERLYTVANDGWGLLYNLTQVAIARGLGYRVIIHHHSFAYLHRYDRRMAWLVAVAGPSSRHLLLGSEMKTAFIDRYGHADRTVITPNHHLVAGAHRNRTAATHPPAIGPRITDASSRSETDRHAMRLGHLSNLSIAKGVGRVLQTFNALIEQGYDVTLTLGGPAGDAQVAAMIDDARRRHPGRLTWLGPVYADAKIAFFQSIDVFVFPTLYPTEAQPLVILESIDAGVPVITTDIGCLPSLVGTSGGCVVDRHGDVVGETIRRIAAWIDQPHSLAVARAEVQRRRDEVHQQADASLLEIMTVCGMPTC